MAASIALVGCSSDDTGGSGDLDSTDDEADDDDGDSSSSVSNSDTSTGTDGDSSSGSGTVDSSGSDGSDSSGSSGGSSDGSDSSGSSSSGDDSTGNEVCMIDLPPPEDCEMAAEPEDGFVIEPVFPQGGINIECDLFAQDCPDGEKCMPWANDGGGAWNATRCSPLDPAPVDIGGVCSVEGSGVSGIDNCVLGSMCWDVDPMTNVGYCLELCSCSPTEPVCNTPNTTCTIVNDGVLPLCLGVCNPLDPAACADEEVCVLSGDYFLCAPDASGELGAAGDPCEFINVCDPGLFCAGAAAVPGCVGSAGCCSALCTVGDDGNCEVGQECVPFYAEGQAPDECLGTVGACSAV